MAAPYAPPRRGQCEMLTKEAMVLPVRIELTTSALPIPDEFIITSIQASS
jgi:hypothetical protein